ncbi:MAG: hypothetical protein GY757_23820 [bacterium]|nr:hypothetical protein [bacterium]
MAVLHEKPVIPIFVKNRHQSAVPGDLAYFCVKGLEKDPEKRFQSIAEMQTMLQRILEGNNPVHCIYTLIKRFSNSFVHMANSYPISTILFFLLMFFFIATGIVSLIGMIV